MFGLNWQARADSTRWRLPTGSRTLRNSCFFQPPEHGFSLIEVLVTLVIVSVGMLGIAGLWGHSLQAGRIAAHSYHSVTLAGDIADRIRANPRAGGAYMLEGENYNCVGTGTNCTPEQLAQNDILLWDRQAAISLPNGVVTIDFDTGTAPPSYQIIVSWTESARTPNYSIVVPVATF